MIGIQKTMTQLDHREQNKERRRWRNRNKKNNKENKKNRKAEDQNNRIQRIKKRKLKINKNLGKKLINLKINQNKNNSFRVNLTDICKIRRKCKRKFINLQKESKLDNLMIHQMKRIKFIIKRGHN